MQVHAFPVLGSSISMGLSFYDLQLNNSDTRLSAIVCITFHFNYSDELPILPSDDNVTRTDIIPRQIIFASANSNAAGKEESEENDNADQGVIW